MTAIWLCRRIDMATRAWTFMATSRLAHVRGPRHRVILRVGLGTRPRVAKQVEAQGLGGQKIPAKPVLVDDARDLAGVEPADRARGSLSPLLRLQVAFKAYAFGHHGDDGLVSPGQAAGTVGCLRSPPPALRQAQAAGVPVVGGRASARIRPWRLARAHAVLSSGPTTDSTAVWDSSTMATARTVESVVAVGPSTARGWFENASPDSKVSGTSDRRTSEGGARRTAGHVPRAL